MIEEVRGIRVERADWTALNRRDLDGGSDDGEIG